MKNLACRIISVFLLASLAIFSLGCSQERNSPSVMSGNSFAAESLSMPITADHIYYGGDILTMVGERPEYVEALAVGDGKIIALGSNREVEAYKSGTTILQDLRGKTLLPGFFDAHSHFYQTAVKLSTVNLDPPPAGEVGSIDDIVSALKEELAHRPRAEGEWLYGWGYDNGMLAENRHPTREDLDKVSQQVPIAIYHFSSHMLVLNSMGLEKMGFTAESVAPPGGVIRRMANSAEPNGIIEEQAIMPVLQQLLASVHGERMIELLDESQELYKRQGYTTMLEMAALPQLISAFESYAAAGKLDIDLAAAVMAVTQSAAETASQFSKHYQQHFRVAGGKVNLDGGSPGRTAYLREPYYTQDAGKLADYRGYPSIADQSELNALVASFYQLKVPLFIHALGDAAIDQAIESVSAAQERFPRDDIRQQLIHLQVFHNDQMQALKKLDVSLSFQITHNYYFADFHAANTLGPKRTEQLCPAGTAWREGFNVTIHHDSPVHPVSQLDLIWIAANRSSRSGKVYGPEERLTPYQALQASTIKAAWQFHEEQRKGSLEVGKLADLVILDGNPLKVAPQDIRKLKVLETIKEGRKVWAL